MTLNPVQVRVLGALIEKEITTPEGYPLSLNALVNACNQKSSRDPVMELDEESVRQALHGLEEMGLVTPSRDSRVPKYEHRARTVLNLRRDETAILCLLMLRGAQTTGELRSRSDRLYAFDDLQSVESTVQRLASRGIDAETSNSPSEPLTVLLPRQAGAREARWMHLLAGAPDPSESTAIPRLGKAPEVTSGGAETRILALEAEVVSLRGAIEGLEHKLETLLQQTQH